MNNDEGVSAFLWLMLPSDPSGRESPRETLVAGTPQWIELHSTQHKLSKFHSSHELIQLLQSCIPLLHLQDSCAPMPRFSPQSVRTRRVRAQPSDIRALWLRAALLVTSSHLRLASCEHRICFLFNERRFVGLLSVALSPRPPSQGAEAHCLWRSVTVRCPVTSRALRSHRHWALVVWQK